MRQFLLMVLLPTLIHGMDMNRPTDKCDAAGIEAWREAQEACDAEADALLDEYRERMRREKDEEGLSGPSQESMAMARKAHCDRIHAKLACVDKLGPTCFDAPQVDHLKNNYASAGVKEVYKSIGFLGPEVIEECAIVGDHEMVYMRSIAGSKECSYRQWDSRRKEMEKCRREQTRFFDPLLKHLPNRDLCLERQIYIDCAEEFRKCLDMSANRKMTKDEKKLFGRVETELRWSDGANKYFSFKSCL